MNLILVIQFKEFSLPSRSIVIKIVAMQNSHGQTLQFTEKTILICLMPLDVCKEFRLILAREFRRMLSELNADKEMLIQANDVLDWLNEAFDAVSAVANQSTLTGEKNTFTNPDKLSRLKMFKHLLETNEVDVDEDGDNEPSAHLLAHLLDVLDRFSSGTALCLVFEGEGKDGSSGPDEAQLMNMFKGLLGDLPQPGQTGEAGGNQGSMEDMFK